MDAGVLRKPPRKRKAGTTTAGGPSAPAQIAAPAAAPKVSPRQQKPQQAALTAREQRRARRNAVMEQIASQACFKVESVHKAACDSSITQHSHGRRTRASSFARPFRDTLLAHTYWAPNSGKHIRGTAL